MRFLQHCCWRFKSSWGCVVRVVVIVLKDLWQILAQRRSVTSHTTWIFYLSHVTTIIVSSLGALENCGKRLSFVMSVCTSIRMEQLVSHWTVFHEILYLSIFRKTVEKSKVWWEYDNSNRYFTWRRMYIYDNIFLNLLRMRNCSNIVETIRTHISCSVTSLSSFHSPNCTVYEILWIMEEYGSAQQATNDNIMWHMHFACLVTKATNTPSEYAILIAFPRHQWLSEHARMLRYTYIACLVWLEL